VVLLERFAVGHARGSSHGTSRIFRLSYPDEEYVRMAQQSLQAWRRLEEQAGEPLLVTTGSLDCGAYAAAHRDAMRACGAVCEELDAEEAERRFGLRLPAGVLLQPEGGLLRADRCVAAFLAGAIAGGADVVENTTVTALDAEGASARVKTSGGIVEARAVVVAAGSWAPDLLARAGIELDAVPTRETVVHLRLGRRSQPPSFIEEVSPGRLPYALASPGIGLKAGVHQTGPVVDPDVEGAPEPSLAAEAAAWAASRFPDADPEPVKVETCLYTTTPDDRFVVERHGRVVVGSACSGHGFKFAPVTGERLAALAVEAAG
jgi:sarcosine oxidase